MKYTEEQACLEVAYIFNAIFSLAQVLAGNQESRILAHHGFLKNLVQMSCHCECCLKAEILTHKAGFHLARCLYRDSVDFSICNIWNLSFNHWKGIDNK